MQRMVVIGGGFAGMWAALVAAREVSLNDAPVAITVVAPDDHLTVRPRLYEPVTPAMRAPLRPLFDPLGIALCLATVTTIDTASRNVIAQPLPPSPPAGDRGVAAARDPLPARRGGTVGDAEPQRQQA